MQEPNSNYKIIAKVSTDGRMISIIFPDDFIGESGTVVCVPKLNGEHVHKIVLNPEGAMSSFPIVGVVGSDGVKYGKMTIGALAANIEDELRPLASASWYAKLNDREELLIGNLLFRLREKYVEPAPPEEPQPRKTATNIEDSILFVNQWAKQNNAKLAIDQKTGEVYAEVVKRIG